MQIKVPNKKSKEVLEFATVMADARAMNRLLNNYIAPDGSKSENHYAIHHSQFAKDPYNFFVVNQNLFGGKGREIMVVINPKILEKDISTKKKLKERCMSFPFRNAKEATRYHRIKVSYDTPAEDGKSMTHKEEWIEGFMAQIFQHEIQHANGGHIYLGSNSH